MHTCATLFVQANKYRHTLSLQYEQIHAHIRSALEAHADTRVLLSTQELNEDTSSALPTDEAHADIAYAQNMQAHAELLTQGAG
jgi:hypothetical protein